MVDMARTLSGQMFYTEHRYYGLSRPTPYDEWTRVYLTFDMQIFVSF